MKNLFIGVLLALTASLFAQDAYKDAMDQAIDQWSNASSPEQFAEMATEFDEISMAHPEKWKPKYYAILGKTIHAFYLPTDEALKLEKELEKEYDALKLLRDDDETKILKGMLLTIKVAKNPMVYGQSLTPTILNTYYEARKENPSNPRVLYQIAEYEILGAPYMGKDPQTYCPLLAESIELFEKEAKTEMNEYAPRWGMEQAKTLFNSTCPN